LKDYKFPFEDVLTHLTYLGQTNESLHLPFLYHKDNLAKFFLIFFDADSNYFYTKENNAKNSKKKEN